MRVTAKGGTDGGSVVLFWPDNLPEDADAALESDPIELIERLQREGKLIWFRGDGDGDNSVSVYVRSPLPESLARICREEEKIPRLLVKGDGYFGGIEYIFKRDSRRAKGYPHMIEKIVIPEGAYSASVYQADITDHLHASWIAHRVGVRVRRLWRLHSSIAVLSVVGVLCTVITLFFVSWPVWFAISGATGLLLIAAIGISKTSAYRAMVQANDEFVQEFPTYVVVLDDVIPHS